MEIFHGSFIYCTYRLLIKTKLGMNEPQSDIRFSSYYKSTERKSFLPKCNKADKNFIFIELYL